MKKSKTVVLILTITIILCAPVLARVGIDRPGELVEIAEQLTLNIQAAKEVKDEMLAEIRKRSERLRAIEQNLRQPGLTRGEKLELQAQRNFIEREENEYRLQALGVVRDQMDSVFSSLEGMRDGLEGLQGQEISVDPEVVQTFNSYFRVHGELIKGTGGGLKISPETMGMLGTLENSILMSQKSTRFLEKSIEKIREYQKVVALYIARLTGTIGELEMQRNVLENERDGITIGVTIETVEAFTEELDMDEIRKEVMRTVDRDPTEHLPGKERRRVVSGKYVEETVSRYLNGNALSKEQP